MSQSDFHLDFYSEIAAPSDPLWAQAEKRLRALASGHKDMIGARVSLEENTGDETPHVFEAQVVAYIKPANLAATEKAASAEQALDGALQAVERQVRDQRQRQRESR